jgi:Tol biopolymer transport system component
VVPLATATSLAVGSTSAQAAFPGADGVVVFESSGFWPGFAGAPFCWKHWSHGHDDGWGSDGNALFTLQPGSSRPRLLTCTSTRDAHPFVSPDGTEVVFSSARHWGPRQLFTIQIGSGGHPGSPTPVSDAAGASDDFPSWSPTGNGTIVFQRTLPGAAAQLYTEDVADPSSASPVFPAPTGSSDTEPVYDPADPTLLAFVRPVSGHSHIFTYDLSSHTVTDLSAQGNGGGTGDDSKPDFAPLGSEGLIVFQSDRACGTTQLYTMRVDGTHQQPVFQAPDGSQLCRQTDSDPVFSPQGDALAFDEGQSWGTWGSWSAGFRGPYDVPVSSSGTATGNVTEMAHFPAQNEEPNWAPLDSPPAQAPEVGLPILLPVAGATGVGALLLVQRRRQRRART